MRKFMLNLIEELWEWICENRGRAFGLVALTFLAIGTLGFDATFFIRCLINASYVGLFGIIIYMELD